VGIALRADGPRTSVTEQHVVDERHRLIEGLRLRGEETHPHPDGGVGGQMQSEARGRQNEEAARDLREQTGTVGRAVGRGCATVRQSRRCLERQAHDFVGALAALTGNESHPTGIARGVGRTCFVVEEGAAGEMGSHVGGEVEVSGTNR
jgi:hypothetical protein